MTVKLSIATVRDTMSGCPRLGKMLGEIFFKVTELSGNLDISQGILHYQPKVREKSGNFEETGL